MNKEFFIPGKISVILDASAGSSGKGKIGSFIGMSQKGKYHFVCNTYSAQASHIVCDKSTNFEYCYKQFNSCAHQHENFEKMYIGQGSILDIKAFFKELEATGIPRNKVGISPLASIVQEIDRLYEEGKVEFSGIEKQVTGDGTIKTGSTCSGVGATRARKVLRDKNLVMAKDVPELAEFICDVPNEILERLSRGQSGLLEICQGYQLSNGHPSFYPNVTSRNVTVVAGLDDMMLPITVVGNVMLNLRTFPIRIASKKYISKGEEIIIDVTQEKAQELHIAYSPDLDLVGFVFKHFPDQLSNVEKSNISKVAIIAEKTMAPRFIVKTGGKHLTWDEVQSGKFEYEVVESYSGDGYDDQEELTWEQVEKSAGIEIPMDVKLTSLTKLPRRVFTFSKKNLKEAIIANQTPHTVFLSLNFVNWVDGDLEGAVDLHKVSDHLINWIGKYIKPVIADIDNAELRYLGTSKYSEDTITL